MAAYREMLRSKIHGAVLTKKDLNYGGSIGIDEDLLEASDIVPNEKVQVLNFNNGSRFETYVIKEKKGSIGIATLSDSIIPYAGEILLDMPNREIHLGFIEKWWLVNPLAFAGVLIAYYKPVTKIPHAGHVLLSTWASLFHIFMAKGSVLSGAGYLVIVVFLFLAVWLPCCISDIVFPLLFVKEKSKK